MTGIRTGEEMGRMPKAKAYSVSNGKPRFPDQEQEHDGNEPMPGSKKVKNRNHSRNNHGEGH